jgi:propionyl-CoA carboxylase alpha chain
MARRATEAIARMRDALNAFVIRGMASNIAFQSALMRIRASPPGNFNDRPSSPRSIPRASMPPTSCTTTRLFLVADRRGDCTASTWDRAMPSISGQMPGHEIHIGSSSTGRGHGATSSRTRHHA